jgi:uncharacterized membrane protein (DUF106 family)
MEEALDSLWFKIVAAVHYIKIFLDVIFAPLNSLGPAFAIFIIAFITVLIAKFLTKHFKTKRYKKLQKEFVYYYNLRQEALKCEDREKGKLLAKNIDQAELNKVYYSYFLEGFLNGLLTKYLPIFSFLAYVNEAYRPKNLLKLFGREYVFKFSTFGGEEIVVGSVFWFVISILLIYLAWSIIRRICLKYISEKKTNPDAKPATA